jgi:hypothetical protein
MGDGFPPGTKNVPGKSITDVYRDGLFHLFSGGTMCKANRETRDTPGTGGFPTGVSAAKMRIDNPVRQNSLTRSLSISP